ncbi:hypothetical protein GCM10009736_03600 [Actinomadura bangladeshensis]
MGTALVTHHPSLMTADPQVADGLADPIGRTPSDAWRNLALFIGLVSGCWSR